MTMVAGKKTQQYVPCGLSGAARLEVINGLLYRWWEEASTGTRNQQLIVLQSLHSQVLIALNDGAGGGHLGVHKTLVKAREWFTGQDYEKMLKSGVSSAKIVLKASPLALLLVGPSIQVPSAIQWKELLRMSLAIASHSAWK